MTRRRTARARSGALLLEVVVALTILVAALGVLGAQLVAGLRLTDEADRQSRAAALVDRLLTMVEFDPELEELILQEERMDGTFGPAYPGWFWELEFDPLEAAGQFAEEQVRLSQVRLRVLYQEDRQRPDDPAGAKLVREVALLKAARAKINLIEDFGMNEAQVEQLSHLLPVANLDPSALDPQVLVTLATQDPQAFLSLLEPLLPLIQQYFGQAIAAQGRQFMQPGGPGGTFGELEGAGGDGGQMSIEDLLRLGEELTGGAASPGTPGAVAPGAGGPATDRRGRTGPPAGGRRVPPPTGVGPDGQPRYTIEDLMRLRDELLREEAGR